MRKFLLSSSIAALLLPGLAFAAYNDAQLAVDTVLSVGGVTVKVSGTAAALGSIAVGPSSFTVSLLPGSFIQVTSATGKVIATDAPANYIVTDSCSATESILKLSSSISTGSMTITPSSSACSGNATGNSTTIVSTGSGSGSAVVSSGGGGGGGGTYIPPTPAASAAPVASNANLTSEQKSALIVTLSAQLNTLLAQLATLQGRAAPSGSFSRDLQTGSTGTDVRALQGYLNSHGFPVTASGAGSPGNETTRFGSATKAALAKFQKSVGITPASGNFGPKTRAYIAAHP